MLAYWHDDIIETTGGERYEGGKERLLGIAMYAKEDCMVYVSDENLAYEWLAYMMGLGIPVRSGTARNAVTVLRGVNRILYHVSYRNASGKRTRVCLLSNLVKQSVMTLEQQTGKDGPAAVMTVLDACEELGLTGMTIGGMAMDRYRKSLGVGRFVRTFPEPGKKEAHTMRTGYIGGYLYAKTGDYGESVDIDVNSLYPWVMCVKPLPYGEAIWYDGRYEKDVKHPLHMDILTFRADLKEGGWPWLTIPHLFADVDNAHAESTHGYITMCLTDVDQKNLYDNYDVSVYRRAGGWKFAASDRLFRDYQRTWDSVKEKSDGIVRQLAKMMMVSLSGKFGAVGRDVSLQPMMDGDRVGWRLEKTDRGSMGHYLPVPMWVNAYGRETLLGVLSENRSRVLYANTDGCILEGWDKPAGAELHQTKMGAWKVAATYDHLRILRMGLYQGSRTDGDVDLVSSGYTLSDPIPWEYFRSGVTVSDDFGSPVVL